MVPPRSFQNDLEILNFALRLEHLEADFYNKVVASGILTGKEQADFTAIRNHEVAHVNFLTAGITAAGGTPVKPRQSYNFDISSRATILATANILEPTGVAAYDGAAYEIENGQYLAAAGAIVQIEARHAARIKAIIDPNANPVPSAFEGTKRRAEIEMAIAPYEGPAQP